MPPTRLDAMTEATAERHELADLLETLDDAAWETPSLCARWSVREVVAHVVSYDGLGLRGLAGRAARGLLLPDRMNAVGVRDHAHSDPADLVRLLREHARPAGLTAAMGGAIGLVDTLIHQQDVRRPLGRPREIPSDRLRFALDFAWTAPVVRGLWNARGVRLSAPEVGWSRGRGEPAEGPAEAVLMAAAGRRGAAADLTGPGADVLRERHG